MSKNYWEAEPDPVPKQPAKSAVQRVQELADKSKAKEYGEGHWDFDVMDVLRRAGFLNALATLGEGTARLEIVQPVFGRRNQIRIVAKCAKPITEVPTILTASFTQRLDAARVVRMFPLRVQSTRWYFAADMREKDIKDKFVWWGEGKVSLEG